jgi:serine/threonine protein phosphatase PrpC
VDTEEDELITEPQGQHDLGTQAAPDQSPAEFQVAQLSDPGRVRAHNEDYVDHYVPSDPEQLATRGAMYVVADGMGGHQAGEVASRAAVELVIEQYYADATHDVGTGLVRAIRAANRIIYEQAQADLSKGGMGTTLVAVVIVGSTVHVANVGDSRAYLIGSDGITQITDDHSWVQEQVRTGMLTPEQARQHPQRNIVTRALGSKPSVEVDLFRGQLAEGDTLLLCSDGLSGLVEDRELQAVVESQPAEEASRTLVAMANERGGADNITVLIVHTPRELAAVAPAAVSLPEARGMRSGAGGLAGRGPLVPLLIGAAVLLALLVVVWLIVLPWLQGTTGPGPATATRPLPTATQMQSPLVTGTAVTPALTPTGVPVAFPLSSQSFAVTVPLHVPALPPLTPLPQSALRPPATSTTGP